MYTEISFQKNYGNGKPRHVGLAKISTIVSQIRSELQPDQVLLIDDGDTIQGTPLAYYHAKKENAPMDPMMQVMNHMGYDAMTVGNHEYNFGLQVLEKARREAEFPWLSANTYFTGQDGVVAYEPYIIKEMQGLKVAVLGLTTPGIPNWEDPANYAGLEFHDPVLEAAKWVKTLREQHHVDIVVVAAHFGLEEDLESGDKQPAVVEWENAAVRLAHEVKGVDVMFLGHTHKPIPSVCINGVMVAEAGRHGDHLARMDLYVDVEQHRQPGQCKVVAIESRLIPVTAEGWVDAKVVEMTESYDQATEVWLEQAIGHCDRTLSAKDARFGDTAIIDLIHRVQLDAGRADISFAASFSDDAVIHEGKVRVRDLAALYIYENTLMVVEVTGAQVKEALEHSASYYSTSDGHASSAEALISGKIPGYNFDIAEGVEYTMDLRAPVGQRIKNLTFKGTPLNPNQPYRVALNNYRKNGGGGYLMFMEAPVVFQSSSTIRDLLIEWVTEHETIPSEPSHNWKLLF